MFLASKTNKPFCTWLGLPIMRWKFSSHHWTPFHPNTKSNFRERYWMFPRPLAQDKLFFLHKKFGPVFWTGCFYLYSIPSSGQVFHLPKDTYLILPSRQNTSHLHSILSSGKNVSPYEPPCFQDRMLLHTSKPVFRTGFSLRATSFSDQKLLITSNPVFRAEGSSTAGQILF